MAGKWTPSATLQGYSIHAPPEDHFSRFHIASHNMRFGDLLPEFQ